MLLMTLCHHNCKIFQGVDIIIFLVLFPHLWGYILINYGHLFKKISTFWNTSLGDQFQINWHLSLFQKDLRLFPKIPVTVMQVKMCDLSGNLSPSGFLTGHFTDTKDMRIAQFHYHFDTIGLPLLSHIQYSQLPIRLT